MVPLYASSLLTFIYGTGEDRPGRLPRLKLWPRFYHEPDAIVIYAAEPLVGGEEEGEGEGGEGREDVRVWDVKPKGEFEGTWRSGKYRYAQAIQPLTDWLSAYPTATIVVAKWNPEQVLEDAPPLDGELGSFLLLTNMNEKDRYAIELEGWNDFHYYNDRPIFLPSPRQWVHGLTTNPELEQEAMEYIEKMY